MITRDTPIESQEQLFFDFDQYADVISQTIMDSKVRPPITILIDGEFGSGKTTLMRRIKLLIEQKSSHIYRRENNCEHNCVPPDFRLCKTFWFDAWKNQDAEELENAFYYQLILHIGSKIKWHLCAESLKNAFDALEFRWIIKVPKLKHPFRRSNNEKRIPNKFFLEKSDEIMKAILYCGDDRCETKQNNQNSALVVFIDDIDRVEPDKIETFLYSLKRIEIMMGTRCFFIYGLNLNETMKAILPKTMNESALDGHIIHKFFQLHFRIPVPAVSEFDKWIIEKFSDVVPEARTIMRPFFYNNPRRAIKRFNNYRLAVKLYEKKYPEAAAAINSDWKKQIAIFSIINDQKEMRVLKNKGRLIIQNPSQRNLLTEFNNEIGETFRTGVRFTYDDLLKLNVV
mgnify:CR=1 FL=1